MTTASRARTSTPSPCTSPSQPRFVLGTLSALVLTLAMSQSAWAQQQSTGSANKAPPPGTMTGAFGQAQLPKPNSPSTAPLATGATTALNASPKPAAQATAAAPALTSTVNPLALSADAAALQADPVSRFLQEHGLLAQAQGESNKLLNQVRDGASDMVLSAMNFLGVRYTRGGSSVESGFDCSGFTRHIFESSVGLILPRRADEQAKLSSLLQVKKEELKPGDLVFFNTMRRTFSHVGIYVGEGKFIHSPRVGGAVRVEDMREAYWSKRFTGARRADLKNAANGKTSGE